MPYNQNTHTIHRENIHNIKMPKSFYERGLSNWIDTSYFPNDSSGQIYVHPGLILAKYTSADSYKYVPYVSDASYGVGSDTAVGVLDIFLDVTLGEKDVSPIFHGSLIEDYCYVLGGTKGDISASIKSDIPDVYWV